MKIEIKIDTEWKPEDDPKVIQHELNALRDAIDGFNKALIKLPEEKRPTVRGFDASGTGMPPGSIIPREGW